MLVQIDDKVLMIMCAFCKANWDATQSFLINWAFYNSYKIVLPQPRWPTLKKLGGPLDISSKDVFQIMEINKQKYKVKRRERKGGYFLHAKLLSSHPIDLFIYLFLYIIGLNYSLILLLSTCLFLKIYLREKEVTLFMYNRRA